MQRALEAVGGARPSGSGCAPRRPSRSRCARRGRARRPAAAAVTEAIAGIGAQDPLRPCHGGGEGRVGRRQPGRVHDHHQRRSSSGRRSAAGSMARACTDCEPLACQPAPESAVSTRGAKEPNATAIATQASTTARTCVAVKRPSRPIGPTAAHREHLDSSPAARRRISEAGQSPAITYSHWLTPDEGDQQQEPRADEGRRAAHRPGPRCPARPNSTRSSDGRRRADVAGRSRLAPPPAAALASSSCASSATDCCSDPHTVSHSANTRLVGDGVDDAGALLAAARRCPPRGARPGVATRSAAWRPARRSARRPTPRRRAGGRAA